MTFHISKIFGSIIIRLGLIFGALAAMTTASLMVAWLVFQSIASNMSVMSDEHLPDLKASADVVASTDTMRDILVEVLSAQTSAEIDELSNVTRQAVTSMNNNMLGEKASLVDRVEKSLFELIASRKDALQSQDLVAATTRQALQLSANAINLLDEASDTVYFELVLGGDTTIETVDSSLTNLIETDFALYQTTLATHSEMNLLTGLALSRTQTDDKSVQAILDDLAAAADKHLRDLLDQLSGAKITSDLAQNLSTAQDELMQVFGKPRAFVRPTAILAIHQAADADLSAALDTIYFDLVIKSEDTKVTNHDSIRALLDDQVTGLREQAALNASTKSFVAAILQVALSRETVALDLNANELELAGLHLAQAMEAGTEDIKANLTEMLKFADPKTGIVATMAASIKAMGQASQATQTATAAVGEIAKVAAEAASEARFDIAASADLLNRQVSTARQRIEAISFMSIVLVIAAPGLIWLMITRPLNRVTRVTERLAQGDLSEITELHQRHGEIGRLTRALQIFRQGALERIQLQADEKRNNEERAAAEQAAEQAKRESEQRARELEDKRAREDQQREAEAVAREEEIRAKDEFERNLRAKEQETVVSALADGLHRLSKGDLSLVIHTAFPESYEGLRQDYNTAVNSLSDIIRQIGICADTINNSSAEIATASQDLSTRTERAAKTLEQTSTALNAVTVGVSSSAQGASNAAKDAKDVNQKTEHSRKVMTDALQAMREIEGSSSKIGQIVSVIDAIAFQTNLLALNAGVEAARAGEAGAGFAVVASEVRQLAHRSSEAADQIKSLVSMSTTQVGTGVTLLAETSKWLDRNLDGIAKMAQSMAEIASSSEDQSRRLTDINQSVEELDDNTQKNTAMFEETTAANQSLTDQARQLIDMVSGFSTAAHAEDLYANNETESFAASAVDGQAA